MKLALDPDFSPENPYSHFVASEIGFGGPFYKSHWETKNGTMVEVADKTMNHTEMIELLDQFNDMVRQKAHHFKSKLIRVTV